ncbi:hypothetical protein ACB094_11G110800 [Castanea mollissima]
MMEMMVVSLHTTNVFPPECVVSNVDNGSSKKKWRESTSGCVFTLRGGTISWRSVKQSCIADSTMEVEHVAACAAAKEAVGLKKFLSDLGVVRME